MKPPPVVRYLETLTREETAFLKRHLATARKSLYKLFSFCMVLSFILPFASAWKEAIEGEPAAFSPFKYYMGVAYLLLISLVIAGISFWRNLRPLLRDIMGGQKVVELTTINRKVHIPQNHSYHLYISSTIAMSIEVEERIYYYLKEGDEINLLFAPHSLLSLGYF